MPGPFFWIEDALKHFGSFFQLLRVVSEGILMRQRGR